MYEAGSRATTVKGDRCRTGMCARRACRIRIAATRIARYSQAVRDDEELDMNLLIMVPFPAPGVQRRL